jgi:hypothetical protein
MKMVDLLYVVRRELILIHAQQIAENFFPVVFAKGVRLMLILIVKHNANKEICREFLLLAVTAVKRDVEI